MTSTSMGTPTGYNIRAKLVVNLLSSPHTEAQELLLAKGPNFALVPKYFPKGESSLLPQRRHALNSPKGSSSSKDRNQPFTYKELPPPIMIREEAKAHK